MWVSGTVVKSYSYITIQVGSLSDWNLQFENIPVLDRVIIYLAKLRSLAKKSGFDWVIRFIANVATVGNRDCQAKYCY